MKCDFCSHPTVARIYQSPRQVMQVFEEGATRIEHHATGGWCACALCAELIDQADLKALANRSVDEILRRRPELSRTSREVLLETSERIHRQFFELREGSEDA